jgi:two-component system response regulator HydG
MSKVNGKIVIVDDDRDILTTAKMVLKQQFSEVITLPQPDSIPDILKEKNCDVIILDMNFTPGETTGKEGIEWLKQIRKIDPEVQVLMETAYGNIDLAVKAIKLGATDFLEKPWSKEKLLATVMATYKLSQSKKQIYRLQTRQKVLSNDLDQEFSEIIAKSRVMKQILQAIAKVSPTDANVLILGNNGTGKELIARAIHRASLRNEEPFIKVDLGAIAETLFETELFGHVKGAFTDAKEDRAGRFEVASGGTLFLDEIGNLSFQLQSKLLTALQTKEIIRVGSNKPVTVDIRLICATNKPIYSMVEENGFRQDLLYRINTVEIKLPDLHERSEDIILLANFFLKRSKVKYNRPEIIIGSDTYKKLLEYKWPGNIRELQHAVERAVIMTDNAVLGPQDFLLESHAEVPVKQIGSGKIEDYEKTAILNAIKKNKGNLSKASKELGFGRSTLYRKMKKYRL